jgi:hypothetical protein
MRESEISLLAIEKEALIHILIRRLAEGTQPQNVSYEINASSVCIRAHFIPIM